jgi:enoyl-CoA hydratase
METIKQQTMDNGVLVITLNRPDKLNALNDNVLRELSTALSNAKKNSAIKGVLFTGEGKAFCAGADINRLKECNAINGFEFALEGQAVFQQIAHLGKPTMAAVNGYAFGGGCELAIACHVRVASESAKFGQPEIKLGIIPGYGGTQRLARLIGKGRAMDLCLTGRQISAEEALHIGLVTQLFSTDHFLASAIDYFEKIMAFSAIALRSIIDTIEEGYDLPLSNALHLEATHFAKVCSTDDKNEGVSAFLEKRTPIFKGE